jgi:MFS family permease
LNGTAFAVFYALFGIPLGGLADSWCRGRLIALGLAVWSSMTALSGLAGSYGQLAIARVGVGIGEASATPAACSLLALLLLWRGAPLHTFGDRPNLVYESL